MPKDETQNVETRKRLDDIYYEVRIGTSMLVFLIIANILILSASLLGFVVWLDTTQTTK